MNYAEAIAAESSKDFIHKIKIVLKELRETHISLKIIKNKPLINELSKTNIVTKECGELIAIFVSSIKTANKNIQKSKKYKI